MIDPSSHPPIPEEAHSRAYYDIAQFLESADDLEARVSHVLERLRSLVPYAQCAVLGILPGREPRLIAAPGTSPHARAELTATTLAIHRRLVHDDVPPSAGAPNSGARLVVPLIGFDEVLGVLFVRNGECAYEERHVRALSVVAAKLAAYLSLVDGIVRETERTEQLAEARRNAEAANRAKDEFLALVSHELRTPLSSILAWTDALRSGDTTRVVRTRALDAIERSVQSQARLIQDLLDLSCVSTATLRLDLRAVEPAKFIQEAIRAVQAQATQKAIRLEVSLDESLMPIVADPHRLEQIVSNLVANAIRLTPEGGHVQVCLERAGAVARLRVADGGTFSAELVPNLFEPFGSADATVHGPAGLGVGLALVKDLVELQRGSVRAESAGDAKGAVVTVEFPLADASRSAQSRHVGAKAARPLEGVRVLIVDDDRDIGEVLQFVLENEGAIVSLVASAAEALSALERSMPDVLLSDIAMPGESGYDLMREIVARKGASAPPAAALSAYAAGHDLGQAQASGFRMLLAKPIDPRALIGTVATLAKQSRDADSTVPRVDERLA